MPEKTVSESRCMRDSAGRPIIDPAITGHLRPTDQIAETLADPQWNPTRAQVAWLIDRAYRSGWADAAVLVDHAHRFGYAEGRRDEAAWQTELNLSVIRQVIDTPKFSARALAADLRQQARRAAWDEWAKAPHRRDHLGGPVEPW